mmetsp:Transcript_2414/g.7627  ORF Transcript_2414/g.7627 Transcript_2414/m.7627 type:complete len:346 (+) Transcript_2414:561-1598(+)
MRFGCERRRCPEPPRVRAAGRQRAGEAKAGGCLQRLGAGGSNCKEAAPQLLGLPSQRPGSSPDPLSHIATAHAAGRQVRRRTDAAVGAAPASDAHRDARAAAADAHPHAGAASGQVLAEASVGPGPLAGVVPSLAISNEVAPGHGDLLPTASSAARDRRGRLRRLVRHRGEGSGGPGTSGGAAGRSRSGAVARRPAAAAGRGAARPPPLCLRAGPGGAGQAAQQGARHRSRDGHGRAVPLRDGRLLPRRRGVRPVLREAHAAPRPRPGVLLHGSLAPAEDRAAWPPCAAGRGLGQALAADVVRHRQLPEPSERARAGDPRLPARRAGGSFVHVCLHADRARVCGH